MRIGIFDSGVGGLNVLKELIKVYPNNHYIYYGDTKNVPYGNKSKDELMILSRNIIKFFERKGVDLIIIACGTISSNCYNDLIKETKIKLYDIISPTIDFINKSKYKNIGLIGTTKTIESNTFQTKILHRNLICKDTPIFVPIIENNEIITKEEEIRKELLIFKDKVECLILGCTHYPLLNDIIDKYLNVDLIDMGKCLIDNIEFKNDNFSKIELYFSFLNEKIVANINKIITSDKEINEI